MSEISTLLTILDPSASPQTGVGDGDSGIIRVGPRTTNRTGATDPVTVQFSASITGGSATLTPKLCNDPDESPRTWIEIKKLKDDGTYTSTAQTASFIMSLAIMPESLVKWTVSGTGSPIPSITMTARGVIRGSA